MKKLVQQKILYFQGFSATLLLHSRTIGGEILIEVGNRITLDADIFRVKGNAGCRDRIDTGRVIHKVRGKGACGDLVCRQIPRQLIQDGGYHFDMGELLRAQRSIGNVPMYQI